MCPMEVREGCPKCSDCPGPKTFCCTREECGLEPCFEGICEGVCPNGGLCPCPYEQLGCRPKPPGCVFAPEACINDAAHVWLCLLCCCPCGIGITMPMFCCSCGFKHTCKMPKEEQIYWESLRQYPVVGEAIEVAAASLKSLEAVKEAVQDPSPLPLEEVAVLSLEVPDQLSMQTKHRQAHDELELPGFLEVLPSDSPSRSSTIDSEQARHGDKGMKQECKLSPKTTTSF
eukprot:gnl/TRDRNA2_/TRDRNA2_171329_c0_seq1.p2 gnl/TRDRNA2_/TRDRNA2_171329_c0~~gnl/TRDRNA2_/TRDRNA2_171329_c0_seq1.p2  ORF type:complete len:230 (-),score=32.19 gnl/TRDRNA2_/TRDRNA2_171329_c0_seq1:206-895(-)